MKLQLKRVYEEPSKDDGHRVLIDRLWPRGETHEDVAMEHWEKEIAPSADLRRDFRGGKDDFEEFSKLYIEELNANPAAQAFAKEVEGWLKKSNVTLLVAEKDTVHGHGPVLIDWLEKRIK